MIDNITDKIDELRNRNSSHFASLFGRLPVMSGVIMGMQLASAPFIKYFFNKENT